MPTQTHAGNKTYLGTWIALLLLTVGMLVTGVISLSQGLLVAVLVIAMMAKATLIGAYFMHLRFEKRNLVLMVAIALLATAAFMYILMALDARHVFNHLSE